MKHEYFNIKNTAISYENTDYLKEENLEDINGDNLFLTFIKENNIVSLVTLASIDNRIYNFNAHKYLNENTEILFAKQFSDIFPDNTWELIYIDNYDIITIELNDNDVHIIEQFEKEYKDAFDKNAKNNILKHNYSTPKYKKITDLNSQTLKGLNGSNIFLAILEKTNDEEDYLLNPIKDPELMEITYKGIDDLEKLLRGMVKSGKIILPKDVTLDEYLEDFNNKAIDDLDKFWNKQFYEREIFTHFIASINGRIFNFCTNEYLDYRHVRINYATSLNQIMPSNKWRLAYSQSGKLMCLNFDGDEEVIDVLTTFQHENGEKIDKEAKTKVLRNGYKHS